MIGLIVTIGVFAIIFFLILLGFAGSIIEVWLDHKTQEKKMIYDKDLSDLVSPFMHEKGIIAESAYDCLERLLIELTEFRLRSLNREKHACIKEDV